ncbi:codanin-1 isoform X2 [Hyla sarda]|uniref:codanin-1 isoform X2 n=1 Tax=Hyla sarda TaxID=327740 RepID=UPI0024C22C86|nr:codanin-1 isoform X2 [Hyla sarda]
MSMSSHVPDVSTSQLQGRAQSKESHVDPTLGSFNLLRKDFVPFLLNFLREQTSQILSNGPSTPAKTPNAKTSAKAVSTSSQRPIPERRTHNSSAHRGSRIQLFTQTPNSSCASDKCFLSPDSASSDSSFMTKSNFSRTSFQNSPNSSFSPSQHHSEKRSAQKLNLGNVLGLTPEGNTARRGRKKNNSSYRHASKDLSRRSLEDETQGENSPWSMQRKKPGSANTSASPVNVTLNLNNLEEFPPMGASCESASKTKPSRRINPTPINDVHSKSRLCFTSTPIGPSGMELSRSGMDVFTSVQEGVCTPYTGSLREEREILRQERSKLLQQTSSPVVLDPITPTKQNYSRSTSVSVDIVSYADPIKVSSKRHLKVLAELYSACITENLVPNIFLELFFVLQLLTFRGPCGTDDRDCELEITRGIKDAVEQQHFQSVHNCVYFAVLVLDFQFTIISLLDKSTLKLLAENERIGAFSPTLQERLLEAYRTSTGKVSLLLPSTLHSVSFQPETDNRSNFPSDRSFHIFKKQRDIFYELLREWEDCHEKTDWDFERGLGNKIRAMMFNLSVACNHSHFARLFQRQLIQMCKGPTGGMGGVGSGDNPDQDLLNMLGSDDLNRLKRLQERFVTPQSVGGPCPPPSFPGYQEFFRDFILIAANYQFNQHLMDSLCQEIQELDANSIMGRETTDAESDMEEQDEKVRFASILLTLRLLAKFLGFVTFLPYRSTEHLSSELQESAVSLRNQTLPMLDVLQLLRRAMQDHRTVLTVPWAVEYLSLVDCVAPYLSYYRKVFCLLLHLYRNKLILADEKEMSLLNKLLLLAVLGWLFQVPELPEEMFFNSEAVQDEISVDLLVSIQGLDSVQLVDQQLLYNCCPYIGELKKLLVSFVAGCGAKNGGFIRKITPTAAEPLMPKPTLSQKKLQAELEQAFFHNQPPSLRRSVEFVAERIGSNCVKHIKATLVADLVKQAEAILKDKVTEDSAENSKLLDSVIVRLCEDGRQALHRGQEYCKKKAPEAVRALLPEETSSCVLRSAEEIAVSLAIEKACTWLNTNISALIRRDVKATFNHMIKSQSVLSSVEGTDVKKGCREGCDHRATLPSRLVTEIKEMLCIALGPRGNEGVEITELKRFIDHLSETLNCRKYLTTTTEHHLAKCTVEIASLLVSDQVPLLGVTTSEANPLQKQSRKLEETRRVLTSLVNVWANDFRVPVPVQIMLRHKNITNIKHVQSCKWELFMFMLQQLTAVGLLQNADICRLQEYQWTSDLLMELDKLVLESEILRNPEEPKDSPCIHVPHTVTGIIAPS